MADPRAINASLLGYLRTAVKLVSSQYAYTSTSFDDSNETASVLCDAIERVLTQGLTSKTSMVSKLGLQTPSFWPYVEQLEAVGGDRGACIPWIRSTISADDARARTWARLALNRRHIGACIAYLVEDAALTVKHYDEGCIIRTKDDCQIMLTLLEGLSSVAFALHIDDKLQRIVHEAWPSARSTPGGQSRLTNVEISTGTPGGRGIIPTPHHEDVFVVPENAAKTPKKKHPKKRIIVIRDEVGHESEATHST